MQIFIDPDCKYHFEPKKTIGSSHTFFYIQLDYLEQTCEITRVTLTAIEIETQMTKIKELND